MQAYSSTLLQFIFKFQLVYFPYFYDDKVQKKCTNLVHSCNQMVHSYFARYSPNRKILAKNARYLPFLSDICLYLPKSHNWGGRGRWFKSSHSDQNRESLDSRFFFYFLANSCEISRFHDNDYRHILPFLSGRMCLFFGYDDMLDH